MSRLKDNGFEYYTLDELKAKTYYKQDLEAITSVFDELPQDEYAPHLNRYRRYARAVIMPGSHRLEWLPKTIIDDNSYYEYFQGSFNPEYTDEYRRFPALPEEIMHNTLLEDIIRFDFQQTFWMKEDALMPVHAGIHFVKLCVNEAGETAVSSPNNLHQDGEPFTFAHLIRRSNVKGAMNAISTPANRGQMPDNLAPGELTASFYLENPLESYGVYDPLVTHYVGTVEKGDRNMPGERSAILIDFQPTVVSDSEQTSSMKGLTDQMIFV